MAEGLSVLAYQMRGTNAAKVANSTACVQDLQNVPLSRHIAGANSQAIVAFYGPIVLTDHARLAVRSPLSRRLTATESTTVEDAPVLFFAPFGLIRSAD